MRAFDLQLDLVDDEGAEAGVVRPELKKPFDGTRDNSDRFDAPD